MIKKYTAVVLVMVLIFRMLSIEAYAAFPTFVWIEEYRSDLYAADIPSDDTAAFGSYFHVTDTRFLDGDVEETTAPGDNFPVFDTIDDGLSTPNDIEEKELIPDDGMNNVVDEEEEPDFAAQSITSYDIKPEEQEEQPISDEGMIIQVVTDEEPDIPVNDISS